MTEVISSILDEINTFQPQQYENMTVIGLNVPDKKVDLMPLEIGLDMGLVEVTECTESGSVNNVKVINNAVTPLLILDGEEIIGSKQNRIVNTTIIIPAKSEKIIPVSCTEAGRWEYNSTKFHYSNHMASSRVRRDKLNSVSDSLRKSNTFQSNQKQVWNNIAQIQDNLEVSSQTSALDDSYAQKSNDIEDYKKEFALHDNQNGLMVYINGQLAGFEIIYNSSRYRDYHDKLVESYIIDAIARQDENYLEDTLTKDDVINRIKDSQFESYDSVGLGKDYRLDETDISGSVMLYEDNLINASFFRKVEI